MSIEAGEVQRGNSGEKQVLINERSIAEQLATKRGFKVIDPEKASLKEIIDACAKARVIAGVEGSHLVHGLMLMPRRSVLFVIQPPHRVVSILKLSADRQGLIYSFLAATGTHDEFSVNFDEVERSIDMALRG